MRNQTIDSFKAFVKGADKNNRNTSNKAVIYTRVSSREQMEKGASLETQKKYCNEFAVKRGFEVIAYFGGTYESAKTDGRKEFKRMLDFVKRSKEVTCIIVYSYDRFSRTGTNGAYISHNLLKRGVATLSVTQELDPNTISGSFQQDLYYLFGKFDNEQRREKCVRGMVEKIRAGYWVWHAPLGYTNVNLGSTADKQDLQINDDGKLLRKAFRWKANHGLSNVEIAKKLTAMGLKITHKKVFKILRNPFYCGVIVNGLIPGEAVKGKHTPLISEDVFFKVNDVTQHKRVGYKVNSENENLPLKVFVKCDHCGTPMTGYIVKKKNIHYYKCRSVGCSKNRNADKLNNLFKGLMENYQLASKFQPLAKAQMTKLFYALNEDSLQELKLYKSQLSSLETKLASIEERYATGEIERTLYEKYAYKFRGEKLSIDKKMGNISISSSNLDECIDFTLDMSCNLLEMWNLSNYSDKQALQQLIFPEGIRYNRENDTVRTERVNGFFHLIPLLPISYSELKKGLNSHTTNQSLLVGAEGFEPPTPWV